jgi:BlaI family penicillinase repressor
VKREACVRAESQSFLDRVFGGAAKPLLVHFAQNSKLSPDEIKELKKLLDQQL